MNAPTSNEDEYAARVIAAEKRFGPHDDHDSYIEGCPGCERQFVGGND